MTSPPHNDWHSRSVLLAAVVLALGWIGYQAVGPAILASLHAGEGPAFATGLAARLRHLPLPYVVERVDTLVAMAMRMAALAWVLLAVALDPAARQGLSGAARGRYAACCAGALVFLLAPWLWLKLAGLCVVTGLLAPTDGERTIPAASTCLLWYAVFLFAFVCAPYWSLLTGLWIQLAALAALLAAGWWWAGLTSAALTLPLSAPGMVGAMLVAAAFHIIPAGVGVPWSGDEDYHLMQVAYLCENLPPVWMVAALGMLLLIRSHVAGGATRAQTARRLAVAAALCGAGYPQLDGALARYPFFLRWFESAPVQLLFPWPTLFYREALVRTSSLVCIMALAAIVFLALRRRPTLALATAVATVTLPTLQYYGSHLYLDLPAITLLTVAALRSDALMAADADAARRDPGWVALVLAAFAKETMLPIVVAFLAARACRFAWTHRGAQVARDLRARAGAARRSTPTLGPASPDWRACLLGEIRLALALVAPLVVYLGFRATQDIFRGYPGNWANYLQPGLWQVLAGSLWEQFGVLAALGVVGTVACCRPGAWGLFWLWGWLAVAMAFNLGDVAEYVGYSRYNLLLLPAVLAIGIAWLSHTGPRTGAVWLAVWLGLNVALTPLRADGTRQLHWGNPQADVGERYYPFRDVLTWLKASAPEARILFAGTTYPYYLDFYFKQLSWRPDYRFSREHADPDPVAAARTAAAAQCGVIVWQPLAADSRIPPRLPGYRLARVYPGEGVILAVYARSP